MIVKKCICFSIFGIKYVVQVIVDILQQQNQININVVCTATNSKCNTALLYLIYFMNLNRHRKAEGKRKYWELGEDLNNFSLYKSKPGGSLAE